MIRQCCVCKKVYGCKTHKPPIIELLCEQCGQRDYCPALLLEESEIKDSTGGLCKECFDNYEGLEKNKKVANYN